MDFYKHKTAPIREKRLSTVSAYYGDTDTLLKEYKSGSVNQRIRTFSQDIYSDIQYALQLINTIKDIAIVVHGPSGCSVSRLYFDLAFDDSVKWAVTNLNERDSIMGSDSKLREAIRQVFKAYSPKLIFVITTPVVAINNDDVESVVDELKEEYNIPIIPVFTDGFRSKTGVSGYDVVLHALIKNLLPEKGVDSLSKGNFINLISVSENFNDIKELVRLLNEIGLQVNILPRFSGLENFTKTKDALFSVSVNPDEAQYPGIAIAERYGFHYLQLPIPVGIKNTSFWFTEIAKVLNLEAEAEKIITEETYHLGKYLDNKKFEGKKVFINLPPAYAFGIIDFLEDIGFEISAIKMPYIDIQHLEQLEILASHKTKIPILIGEGQVFEEVNIINQLKPELYISSKADNIIAIKEGIPVIDIETLPVLGYKGVYNLIDKIEKKLYNPSFSHYLSTNNDEVYSVNWLQKKGNWYIKQEVK
jgi:nitrogenase molybdenum-iron protein alpha/beta subunit